MAFNIRKTKRLPGSSMTDDVDSINTVDSTTQVDSSGSEDPDSPDAPSQDEDGGQGGSAAGKNIVATHGWVYSTLKKFWNWTKFFATESMQVAGGVHAGRVSTCELQTNDIYATRLYLIDKNGKPMLIYLDEAGDLKCDYDFQNVFVYPGDGNIDVKTFVYRYGKDPYSIPPDDKVAPNFVGLTPYEILMNFVPHVSNGSTDIDGKTCYRLCAADGADELVGKTLLVTCPTTKKIVDVRSFDRDGGLTKIYEVPVDREYKRMTINMPTFVDSEQTSHHVLLPGDFPAIGGEAFRPFFPPFLRPPKPTGFIPPAPPFMPPGAYPAFPNNDIFDDDAGPIPDDDFFQDITKPQTDVVPNKPVDVKSNYTVTYEDYELETYFNLALKRDRFEKNKEQFLMVTTADLA